MSGRARTWAGAAAGLLALAYLATRLIPSGEPDAGPLLRPAPQLPEPGDRERAAYFFDLMKGRREIPQPGQSLSAWVLVGQPALVQLGGPALDYLLSEKRLDEYRTMPDLLANVLALLPAFPEAGEHPRLVPFLQHWLVPANCPPRLQREGRASDWAEDLRKLVFQVYARFPDASALPACREELRRVRPLHELRPVAVDLIFALGRAEEILDVYAELPPDEEEPHPEQDLRLLVLDRAHRYADPDQGEASRAEARKLEPLLRRLLTAERNVERVLAAATLLRLGDEGMVAFLLEEFERLRPMTREPDTAWDVALMLLAQDRPLPRIREICVAKLERGEVDIGYAVSARILAREWSQDPEVRARLWPVVRSPEVPAGMLLPSLARADRTGAVAYLREEIESGDWDRIAAATALALQISLTEIGPALFDLVSHAEEGRRPFLYHALAALRMERVIPLLAAELNPSRPDLLRDAAAVELLQLEARLDAVAAALERGDRVVLEAVQRRARTRGRAGLPDELLPAVLRNLREQPGEDGRRTALLALRFRGTLEGVRDELIDAYRREPSRRIAEEIREVLIELAHR